MIKPLFLEDITFETIKQLIKEIYEDDEAKINLYINSRGGGYDSCNLLIEIINENPDRFKIYAVQQILSSGFNLFFKTTCEKHIIKGCTGMFHQAIMTSEIRQYKKIDPETLVSLEYFEKEKNEDLKFMKELEFTEEEMEKYFKGEDIWFSYNRLIKFLELTIRINQMRILF